MELLQTDPEVMLEPMYAEGKPTLPLKNYNVAGSQMGCHLYHPSLQPKHFCIQKRADQFELRDLNTQQCYVNNTKIISVILQPGDIIQAGGICYRFTTKSSPKDPLLESKNPSWQKTLNLLPSIALSDFTVSIKGASGTGKELMARKIHQLSKRKDQAFISLNCSALSAQLIESELFGHQKGSFTDAYNNRKGAFESARRGTLFLDEIGDLPLDLQPKLLRALENQEIRPVGSDKIIKTDTRILVATHQNLRNKVLTGEFRQDLYYRLNVIELKLPNLTDRLEDFETLFYSFCKEFQIGFEYTAIEELKKHSWPGNIRELKNIVQRASALFLGRKIKVEDLSDLVEAIPKKNITRVADQFEQANKSSGSMIRELEKQLIIEKLVEFKGNQRRAADYLGLPKSTLHDRIKKYEINIKEFLR